MLRNSYAFLKTTECKARSYLGIAVYVLKKFCSLKLVSQSSEPSETPAWVLGIRGRARNCGGSGSTLPRREGRVSS